MKLKQLIANNEKKLAIALLLIAMFFWGISFVVIKVGLNEGVPPMTLNAIRFTISAIIIYPLFKTREPATRISKKELPSLLFAGVFGVALYFFFETIGVQYTTASNASLIIASIPIFTMLTEVVVFKKRVSIVPVAGIFLSLIGVYLLITQAAQSSQGNNTLIGNLLMLGACLSWVAYVIVTKKVVKQYSGLALTTYQIIFGAVLLCPLALLEMNSWKPISLLAWGSILFLAVTCSVISYICYNYALKHISSIIVSTYLNLLPVISVICGVLLLGESISLMQGVGGLIVIASIMLVNFQSVKLNVREASPPVEY